MIADGRVRSCVAAQGLEAMPIPLADAERAGRLSGPQRDPFDRMLNDQALSRDLEVVSDEGVFDDYRLRRLW